MNTRFCTVVTVATLVCLSTGCSGMKNFLFGRGARCGLCSKLGSCLPAPRFGNMMQAPTCQAPAYSPAPAYAPQATYAPAPSCGCNEYAGNGHGEESYASGMCNTCGDSYGSQGYAPQNYGSTDYGVNGNGMGTVGPYGNSDPYMNTPSMGTPMPGQQINGETVVGSQPMGMSPSYPSGTSYPSAPSYNGAPVQSDNFQSRKFDTDGNKILWEEPMSPGTQAL